MKLQRFAKGGSAKEAAVEADHGPKISFIRTRDRKTAANDQPTLPQKRSLRQPDCQPQ
ncbi:hypothetical protein WBP07_20990 (plasmid) [Novosphingobium sp. BL-8A]|uniref:hypothetical protein n=1 Tax=Novosphingobium sp. BL-8A TaxID=3127639 RepID=UPI0037564A65